MSVYSGEWYDALLMSPKPRSLQLVVKKPDAISDKVREVKLKLMSFSTLDKKLAYFMKFYKEELLENERCIFLQLFKQSLYRDFFLCGLGIFISGILIKEGISSHNASKLFKLAAVSTGIASIGFAGQVVSDWIPLFSAVEDLERKECSRNEVPGRG